MFAMKFLDWNENKIINLFITQFLYLPGSSQTEEPGKYKKSLVSLSRSLPYVKIQSYIKRPARFARRSITTTLLQ